MWVNLDIDGARGFQATFPYSEADVKTIRKCLGFAWEKKKRAWVSEGPEVLVDMERLGIKVRPTNAAIQRLHAFYQNLNAAIEAHALSAPDEEYGFQQIGTQVLLAQKRGIIADEMGLGKTKQSLDALYKNVADALASESPSNSLIVVLKTKVWDWPEELQRWHPDLPVLVLPDAPAKRKKFWDEWNGETVVINYEKLILGDWPAKTRWNTVIVDEATYVKNHQASRSRALKREIDRAENAYLITGTPIEIRLEELYGLFRLIRPSVFGSFPRFRDEHLTTDILGNVTGARRETLPLLHERIAPWIIRRTKGDDTVKLPPKVYVTENIEMSAVERDQYQDLLVHFDEWLEEQGQDLIQANALVQLLRLQQFTSSPELLPDVEREDDDIAHSSVPWRGTKFLTLQNILADWDGQALVFTRFSTMANYLVKWLHAHPEALISGDITSAKVRKQRVDRFNRGELGKVLISTDAGAHGLNIQSADLVVQYDQLWNPAKMQQREDRIHRIGQTKSVTVMDLIVLETIDEGMKRTATQRAEFAESVYDGAEDAILRKIDLKGVARGGGREGRTRVRARGRANNRAHSAREADARANV